MKTKNVGDIVKSVCVDCKRVTSHKVLASTQNSGYEDWGNGEGLDWSENDLIIQCQGCEAISFLRESSNSEDYDQFGPCITTTVFPDASVDTFGFQLSSYVPENISRIFRESIKCFNSGAYILCAVGIRAVIEAICNDKKVKSGNVRVYTKEGYTNKRKSDLRGKIAGLYEKGILTKRNADILHQHRFLGNEAIHELSVPTKKELMLALEIAHNLIMNLYDIPVKAAELKQARIKRS